VEDCLSDFALSNERPELRVTGCGEDDASRASGFAFGCRNESSRPRPCPIAAPRDNCVLREGAIGKSGFLLHAWNTAKEETTLDFWVWAPDVRVNRHRRARPAMKLQRINRIGIGRVAIISDNYSVRTAPLNAQTNRGAVISLKYYEEQVAVAYTTIPMLVVTLPNGLSGQAITQDFSTEGQSEGGTYFEPRIGANGQVFLVKVDYSPINKMQTETRFRWSGRKYVSEGRSVEVPMPPE